MRSTLGIVLATIVGALLFPAAAQAGRDPDSNAIAARCVARIQEIGAAAVGAIERTTARTVAAIDAAQSAGDREGARMAARTGANRANHIADRSTRAVSETARQCLRALRRAGADPELLRRVAQTGRAFAAAVDEALGNCIARIRRALNN